MLREAGPSGAPMGGRAGSTRGRSLVTIAAPEESDLMRHGLARMLAPFGSRVRLLEPATEAESAQVDVVLFDCFPDPEPGGLFRGRTPTLRAGPTVAYSWYSQPALVAWALDHGFDGYLSKALPICELVEALEALRAGETPVRPGLEARNRDTPVLRVTEAENGGLTPREAETLRLVCSGLSNREIAGRMQISPNSLKSYIRSTYRKIDVASRAQALLWGIEHGYGGQGRDRFRSGQ